jgi:hypothetical protein
MHRLLMSTTLLIILLGTMSVSVSAQNMTSQMPGHGGPPSHTREPDGSEMIRTDIITIKANGEIPQFEFWYSVDENGTHAKFMTSFVMIAEFEDANHDGAFQIGEQTYFAPLAAYEWTLTTGSIQENGVTTEIWLKYTKSGIKSSMMPDAAPAALSGMGNVQRFKDTTIQIWGHIYLNDYTGEITDDHGSHANYTVAGGSELKIDVEIGNFPFSSADSMVALQTLQRENIASGTQTPQLNQHRIETRERFRNVTMDSNMNWTTESGNETRFENMPNSHLQKIDFVDYEAGLAQGFFSWVDTAVITWPGGTTEAVPVNASYVPTGMGLAVYLAYPYFDNGSILHDPSIGLYPNGVPLITPSSDLVLVIGIGIVSLVAILAVAIRKR